MYAWVTPEDPPGDTICLKVYCPSGVGYEAALRGAILSLTEVKNWENVNGQDVDTVASAFFDAYQSTLLWEICGMPIGTVISGGWQSAPEHYVLCDGASYSVAEYGALFDVIGYSFGGSGGAFNVPNMTRNFPVGAGGALPVGSTGGAETVTLNTSQIPSHNHSVHSHLEGVAVSPGELPVTLPSLISGATGSAGGGGSHENRPPFVALNYAIRFE
jgi:microcystin-dependent protein